MHLPARQHADLSVGLLLPQPLPALDVESPRPGEEREYLTAAESFRLLQATRPATFGAVGAQGTTPPHILLERPQSAAPALQSRASRPR